MLGSPVIDLNTCVGFLVGFLDLLVFLDLSGILVVRSTGILLFAVGLCVCVISGSDQAWSY